MASFGLQLEPQFGYSLDQLVKLATLAEQLGYSHVWVSDHFMLHKEAHNAPAHETIATMMAIAASTSKLRIGSLVLCNSYRHPAVLAKQLVTLDHFSKGRIEVGYGAGWKQLEYEAYGIPFPPKATRLNQLEEGIQILKQLWTKEHVEFEGTHYQLNSAILFPKPLQSPRIPLLIGSMKGKRRMLEIAVKHADGINLAWAFSPAAYEQRIQLIQELAEKHERDLTNFRYSVGLWTRIFADEHEKHQFFEEQAKKRNVPVETIEERYEGALYLSIEETIEQLKEYQKIGITDFVFMLPYQQEEKAAEQLMKEVLSHLH